jgi:hypothetical protein
MDEKPSPTIIVITSFYPPVPLPRFLAKKPCIHNPPTQSQPVRRRLPKTKTGAVETQIPQRGPFNSQPSHSIPQRIQHHRHRQHRRHYHHSLQQRDHRPHHPIIMIVVMVLIIAAARGAIILAMAIVVIMTIVVIIIRRSSRLAKLRTRFRQMDGTLGGERTYHCRFGKGLIGYCPSLMGR